MARDALTRTCRTAGHSFAGRPLLTAITRRTNSPNRQKLIIFQFGTIEEGSKDRDGEKKQTKLKIEEETMLTFTESKKVESRFKVRRYKQKSTQQLTRRRRGADGHTARLTVKRAFAPLKWTLNHSNGTLNEGTGARRTRIGEFHFETVNLTFWEKHMKGGCQRLNSTQRYGE